MSYCGDVHSTWTSDYNYRGAIAFLSGGPQAAAAARTSAAALAIAPARERCLVVPGRVTSGEVELVTSFVLETVPSQPPGGVYELELLDRGGARLASLPFAATLASAEEEGGPDRAHFAMAIPLPPALGDAVHGVAVRRGGVELARRTSGGAPGVAVEVSAAAGRTVVRWDHRRRPEVLVRDARTGQVLQF